MLAAGGYLLVGLGELTRESEVLRSVAFRDFRNFALDMRPKLDAAMPTRLHSLSAQGNTFKGCDRGTRRDALQ
jgi:hypothetical protein